MAKRPSKQDAAKAKAAKQKKIAIGGGVLLAILLVVQVPRTMKMLNTSAAPPVAGTTTAATTTTPTVTPGDPNSLAAPTLGGTPTTTTTADTSDLVDAVPLSADTGQLQTFQKFASKDPFAVQVGAGGSATPAGASKTSGGSTSPSSPTLTTATATTPSTPSTPAGPAPTSAIISLNGEPASVAVGSDFPTAGATFARVGSLFHLLSLTTKTARIAIVGGSYASGAPAITLKMGTPLTLQNTADGTKYTLILEPPTTQLPSATGSVAGAPTSTTSAVPSGSGG